MKTEGGQLNVPAVPGAVLLHDGQRLPLPASGLVVGRRSDNDVVIQSDLVSRHHARLDVDETGEYVVTDLGSLNGTYLNGERLRRTTRALRAGDTIVVGGETFRFVAGEATRIGGVPSQLTPVESVRLDRARLTIGRDASNDLTLIDPNVSRFHAEIRQTGDRAVLRDLGSTNGTRVDGDLITRRELEAGDEITIGPFRLTFDGTALLARDERGGLRLDAHDVSVAVDGGREILAPTSLSVEPGEFVAILGESGAGKSTLIKALAGVTEPSGGRVLVSGNPVRARITEIGYVPQDEIVHPLLTVREALSYAARLRLPEDTGADEISQTVERTLEELSLTAQAETRIGSLSGGQRKRVGVATELLSRPSLLCLDEPTTGLDPALEARMMKLLRDLSGSSRAVIVVTHATRSLAQCDKIVVLARGGHLCFAGPPADALAFFEVDHADELYSALETRSHTHWQERLAERDRSGPPVDGQTEQFQAAAPTPASVPPQPRRSAGRQSALLLARYARLFSRDRRNLAILFGQVPLIALAIAVLFASDVFEQKGGTAQDATQLLFLLATVAVWFGSISAAREIVKEQSVLARETAVGLRLSAYLFSKFGVLFAVTALQTLLLVAIVLLLRSPHEEGGGLGVGAAVLVLTSWVAVAMGLLVSAAVRTQDQATSFIPLVLIPQLLYAGALVPPDEMSGPIGSMSKLVFAQWSFAGLGSAFDMNARIAADEEFAAVSRFGSDFFDVGPELVAIMAAFFTVFAAASYLLLNRRLR